MSKNLLADDLDYIFEAVQPYWTELRNKNLFITGGTGFFGCWFLESLIWASKKLNLNNTITVLTRDIISFKKKYPRISQVPYIDFHQGDIRNFQFIDKKFDFLIHAACDIASFQEANPINGIETIVQGTTHTLEFARHCHATNILFISSGSVYGKQPTELIKITEESTSCFRMQEAKFAYGIGKQVAEHLCQLYHQSYQLNIKIARCFTFIGPYLPLNSHFATSHFIKSALTGTPIIIQSPIPLYRSYLYAAELIIWLWKILFCGKSLYPYNVGSDQAISISELANLIAESCSPRLKIIQSKPWNVDTPAEYYVPDISRSMNELGVQQKINLTQAIDSTLNWYRNLY